MKEGGLVDMERDELPKRVLIIKDCAFILPDDFEGTVEEAFDIFLKYRAKLEKSPVNIGHQDLFSAFDVLLHTPSNIKACGQSSVYKLINDSYVLFDGTGVSSDDLMGN